MRLVTLRTAQGTRAGRLDGDVVTELPFDDVGQLLAAEDWRGRASAAGPQHELGEVVLAPVVPRPPKIICVGLNYLRHVKETGGEVPAHPTLFAKYACALIGPRDPIVLPRVSRQVDWEAEMAFVIGVPGRHIPRERALDHIAGWTVLNDVSVRDWQLRTTQYLSGKTFEGTTPVGPSLVTRDEVSGDGGGLGIRTVVDGEVVQDANTSDLLFAPADLVSYISTIVTLEPGDIISTGTPEGVALGRRPAPWLRAGQVVTVSIEGVGELVNECVDEAVDADAEVRAAG